MEKDENSSDNNIAGGQTSWGKPSTFSTNIEKILMKAVLEKEFKTTLLEDRKSVIDNPEFSLTPQDKAMLKSIPSTKLNNMIDTLSKQRRSRRDFLTNVGVTAAFALIAGAFIVPSFLKARAQGNLAACESNIKNLATALEMYATDHTGTYPESLDNLTKIGVNERGVSVGPYIKTIPLCPASKLPSSYGYKSATVPDYFTLWCKGDHTHEAAGQTNGYPQYAPGRGMVLGTRIEF
jgi:hypothetical protein